MHDFHFSTLRNAIWPKLGLLQKQKRSLICMKNNETTVTTSGANAKVEQGKQKRENVKTG